MKQKDEDIESIINLIENQETIKTSDLVNVIIKIHEEVGNRTVSQATFESLQMRIDELSDAMKEANAKDKDAIDEQLATLSLLPRKVERMTL